MKKIPCAPPPPWTRVRASCNPCLAVFVQQQVPHTGRAVPAEALGCGAGHRGEAGPGGGLRHGDGREGRGLWDAASGDSFGLYVI